METVFKFVLVMVNISFHLSLELQNLDFYNMPIYFKDITSKQFAKEVEYQPLNRTSRFNCVPTPRLVNDAWVQIPTTHSISIMSIGHSYSYAVPYTIKHSHGISRQEPSSC